MSVGLFLVCGYCYVLHNIVHFPNETHHSLRTGRETMSWSPEVLVSKNCIPEVLNLRASLFYSVISSLLNIPIYVPQEWVKRDAPSSVLSGDGFTEKLSGHKMGKCVLEMN